jgi:hypothetical protein
MTDFAQLLPERVAAVVFQNEKKKFRLAVSGTLGINQEAVSMQDLYAGISKSRRFFMNIERAEGPIDEPTSWVPVNDKTYELVPQWSKEYKDKMVWVSEVLDVPGSMKGPDVITSGDDAEAGPYRVVVREYEYLPQDKSLSTAAAIAVQAYGGRLVYVDTINLQPTPTTPNPDSGPQ